ncbi:MAG: MarR family transcriptional regulator [Thermodesulfobacteriota bacterium]
MTNSESDNRKWTETEASAWIGLVQAQQSLIDKVEDELKKNGFPCLSWYDVLWELERSENGRLRLNDLGNKVLLDKYSVTRLAQRLEEEGLVQRGQCPNDGRGITAQITNKGKKLRKQMWPIYEKVVRENFLCKFNKKELKELKNFIERIKASGLDQDVD